jgi:hypothetical protein
MSLWFRAGQAAAIAAAAPERPCDILLLGLRRKADIRTISSSGVATCPLVARRKRLGSSIAVTKAMAVSTPTPGTLASRRQTGSWRARGASASRRSAIMVPPNSAPHRRDMSSGAAPPGLGRRPAMSAKRQPIGREHHVQTSCNRWAAVLGLWAVAASADETTRTISEIDHPSGGLLHGLAEQHRRRQTVPAEGWRQGHCRVHRRPGRTKVADQRDGTQEGELRKANPRR